MNRVAIYGILMVLVGGAAALMWSDMHPDPLLSRARTEQAERMQVDPPPVEQTEADDDRATAVTLESLRALQGQMAGIVDAYCREHGAMPARISDLAVPQVQGNFAIGAVDLHDGSIDYQVLGTEQHAPGVIRWVATMDGHCAREWQCTSGDFPRVARWLAECRFTGAETPR